MLVDGGKHYGHLEVNVKPLRQGRWEALLEPIYVFPIMSTDGSLQRFERRVYDDVVTLVAGTPETAVLEDHTTYVPRSFSLSQNSPNPFNSSTVIRFALPETQDVALSVYNLTGQKVTTLANGLREAGTVYASMGWTGRRREGIGVRGVSVSVGG